MGVNTIQREGITLKHDAKFMLIGTMNPEEGDLRPQLLDRFGLMVDVQAPRDPRQRCEVVRQRITFERDPALFQQAWQQSSTLLTQQVVAAQERLTKVILKDELLLLISTICTEMHVDSLRADITLYKTATALAAWEGRLQVAPADIKQAAQWVLPHRKRKKPFESPQSKQQTEEMLEELINNHNNNDNSPPDKNNMDQQEQEQQQPQPQEQNDNREGTGYGSSESAPSSSSNNQDKNTDNDNDDRNGEGNQMETFKASKPEQIKRIKLAKKQQGQPGTGRRNTVTNSQQNKQGHYVRSVPTDKPQDIALDATLRAAAVNGLDPDTGATIIKPENWRRKVRHATTDTLILFVVDASGSMSARQRMETVKGAVLALLTDAYQQRDSVGVIAFRGLKAEVLLEPTRSVELAEQQLKRLPTGGRTPLAHALVVAHEAVHRLGRHQTEQQPMLLIVLSDGKANVPLPDTSGDAWAQTEQAAAQLADLAIPTLFLDTETGMVRVGRGKELAQRLNADYLLLDDLSADGLVHTIREVVG
ncbi:chelatase 67 kDa subunit [Seminavis robusta]|uniref:magnesium chelatase n=2 Tax=Seminavis robusta TaxID=568900 RepID=A0A9N8EGE7_9STRA|nr:chelatase 67 kDa subunit [Seminavis robusta]|eukprot:Sro962_g225210.1 chelatase 67 kDa subunit (533) ;mRNA; r:39682-41280